MIPLDLHFLTICFACNMPSAFALKNVMLTCAVIFASYISVKL